MKFILTGILVGATLLAACGEDPADVGVGTTGPVSQSAPVVTTTLDPATSTTMSTTRTTNGNLGSLEDQLEAAGAVLRLDIPGEAWVDAGVDACGRGMDSNLLITLADDLVSWAQDDQPGSAETTLLAAQILWSSLEIICPETMTDEFLQAGPPDTYEFPRCEALIPAALPWSEEVGDPDDREVLGGVVIRWWRGPVYYTNAQGEEVRQQMTTLVGRGDIFERIMNANQSLGEILEEPMYLIGYDGTDTSAVEVAWSSSGRWCDAAVIRLNPDPVTTPVAGAAPVSDLAAYVKSLMFVEPVRAVNKAKAIIVPAVAAIEGVEPLGGDHDIGEEATEGFELDGYVYSVYAVPTENGLSGIELGGRVGSAVLHGGSVDQASFDNVEVVFYDPYGSVVAVFDRAGLTIILSSLTVGEPELLATVNRLVSAIDQVAE